jgi:catechol 2,3-dioxygenase-like lactoylglutathione lyase family enzyme
MALEITHIRHIGLFSPRVEEQARFYTDIWGLDLVDEREDAVYLRGASGEPYLLSLHKASRKGLHHVAYGMASREAVERAAVYLNERGIRVLSEPAFLDEPGGGLGFRFLDPDRRCVELSSGVAGPAAAWRAKSVEPSSICHVVLNTPGIDRLTDFYTSVLGFRESDWSEHQMVFLRVNNKHHSISFNLAPHASVNHVAYLLSGVDELMLGASKLRKLGVEPVWGPGRHGPGNNIFCYFRDPAGYITEYTSNIDFIVDEAAHRPKVWPRSPESIDRWGGGPPAPEVRAAMTGEPDPGWAG